MDMAGLVVGASKSLPVVTTVGRMCFQILGTDVKEGHLALGWHCKGPHKIMRLCKIPRI